MSCTPSARVCAAFSLALSLAQGATADACGGCFAPPRSATVVTDHRMALALGADRTVLWDQIRYAGAPEDFSWVLPIRDGAGVRVEVASSSFLALVEAQTSPAVAPPRCARQSSLIPVERQGAGVVVHRQETVGPYALTIVGGSDPRAIRRWLADNGYAVPDAVAPMIDLYTELRMDFAALRLRPGLGVSAMTPVRVSAAGYAPTLPLRMIAAGAGDSVGLSLVVFAPSQVEAQNFPNGAIEEADLAWDWLRPTDPAQDFRDAFDRRNRAAGGRLWLTESVQHVDEPAWRDAADAGDEAGAGPRTRDDLELALSACGDNCVVTRLRAELPRAALDRDLVLDARKTVHLPRTYSYGTVRPEDVDPSTCAAVLRRFADAGAATPADAAASASPCARDAGCDGGSDAAADVAGPPPDGDAEEPPPAAGSCACRGAPGPAPSRLAVVFAAGVGLALARRRNRRGG